MAKYPPGAPCWADLGSPDVEASKQFYTALFGWTAETSGPEYGGYTNFFKDGKMVCAVGPLQMEGQPPVWTAYFLAPDVEKMVTDVEAAGGKVLAPPMEIPPFGHMAIFLDQAGAAFGAWQPNEMHGAELMGEAGSVGWFELLTDDLDGSTTFYPAVLGLSARGVDMDESRYTLLEHGADSLAGIGELSSMGLPPQVPAHWLLYFAVEDADAAVARAVELGGAVVAPPIDTPPGRFALLADVHGAPFAVIKGNPDFQV